MKRVLGVIAQFLLLLFVDAVGSLFYHPFRIQTSLTGTSAAPRSFVWDGAVLMLLVYVLVLLIAVLRKRLSSTAPGSSLALVAAALAGYLLKFGFITRNW